MTLIDLQITGRARYAEGREFGEIGPYIVEHGVATYALDPTGSDAAAIVDLERAPRDEHGRVVFQGDIRLLRPFLSERAAGIGIIDVVNRGRPLAERYLNHFDRPPPLEPSDPEPGDGFVFTNGWTILNVGWQHDLIDHPALHRLSVPMAQNDDGTPLVSWVSVELNPLIGDRRHLGLAAPGHTARRPLDISDPEATLMTARHQHGPWEEVARDSWSFAKQRDGERVSSDRHVHLDGGFAAGRFYSVRYRSAETPVGGVGMAALRDAAEWLHGAPGVQHVVGFGVSQTGRLLRHLCHSGLNTKRAFDGLYVHIAGARRGEFNDRQASPGVLYRPSLATVPPYDDSIFRTLRESDAMPKVMLTNTSTEYWRSDASLVHTDLDGLADLPSTDDVRIYHHSGTQHVTNPLPQTSSDPATGATARYGFNAVDNRVLLRAEMTALTEWVRGIADPPPSRHPRIDDQSLTTRPDVAASLAEHEIEGFDLDSLPVNGPYDLGPDAVSGVIRHPVSPTEGNRYRSLVAAVDDTGNEVGGVTVPSVAVPVAVHTGWNVLEDRPDSVPGKGMSRFETPADLADRYGDRDRYLELVAAAADVLIGERRLLEGDRRRAIGAAAAQWDAAHG